MEGKKIIRVAREDLNATLPIERSLWKIKGVGKNFAHAVRVGLGHDSNKKLNELTEKEIKKLEDCIYHPEKYNIPNWLYNKRRDIKTGEDKHFIGSDLVLRLKNEIDFLKKIRCYRGVRHWSGRPVRGQRTRGHFRKGGTVGVKRKKK
jgi:small subunit ribosomal protein S13